MAKRTFLLNISVNTDWYFIEENTKSVYDGEYLKTNLPFAIVGQKNGKIISIMCQGVSEEDIKEADKLEMFKEEVVIKVKVDSGHPNSKHLSSETFEGQLIDALIYVHETNKELS